MKKWILIFVMAALPLLFLPACFVIPGTATLQIYNEMTACRRITALYLYIQGDTDKGPSIISAPLCPNEYHIECGVDPGEYIIEAEIDDGAETAIRTQTVEEDTYHIFSIYDSDIIKATFFRINNPLGEFVFTIPRLPRLYFKDNRNLFEIKVTRHLSILSIASSPDSPFFKDLRSSFLSSSMNAGDTLSPSYSSPFHLRTFGHISITPITG